jgi:hypothetical protein
MGLERQPLARFAHCLDLLIPRPGHVEFRPVLPDLPLRILDNVGGLEVLSVGLAILINHPGSVVGKPIKLDPGVRGCLAGLLW